MYASPSWFGSAVRLMALKPKGCGFNFWSRAHIPVVSLILGPGLGVCGRQPIDVSHRCFSLFLPPPSLALSLKFNRKISSGEG